MMIQKNTIEVDVILDVLKRSVDAFPASTFVNSLLKQYQERGSLSKKQLEGLHSKASKIKDIAPGKLATLQAIILKKPTRYKSTISKAAPIAADTNSIKLVTDILEKYPQHKRVLLFQMKLDNLEPLTALDQGELKKFHNLLIK
ncbi:hypothetical protein BH11BAC4_BH11BAC4_18110 [soil metagenome]